MARSSSARRPAPARPTRATRPPSSRRRRRPGPGRRRTRPSSSTTRRRAPRSAPASRRSPTPPHRAYALLVKKLQAALYLFEATGTTSYRDFFDANYATINLIKRATPTARTARSRRRCSSTRTRRTRPPRSSPTIKTAYLGVAADQQQPGRRDRQPRSVPGVPLDGLLVGDQPDQERPGEPALRRRHLRDRCGDQRHGRQGGRALRPLAARREPAAARLPLEHGRATARPSR